jgi:hypothetical protein
MLTLPYGETWFLDTEFNFRPTAAHTFPANPQPDGSIQHPVCLVAQQLNSGRKVEVFEGEFGPEPPFSVGPENLFIAYNAVAEWLTFLALGLPLPCRVFDLYIEYRRHICGTPWDLPVKGNKSLLMALAHFGVPGITADQKDEERDFILRGGPWKAPDQRRIKDYCYTDVRPLPKLAERLLYADCCGEPLRSNPAGLAQAIHRGRFSLAAARMEHTAIAVDTKLLDPVTAAWDSIRATVIEEMDEFGVYPDGHFNNAKFLERMDAFEIPWPRVDSGLPKTDKDTFKDMVRRHPRIKPISELRYRLSEMHLERLQIGADGRNRTSCMMFGSKTGRNTPSQNKYLFGVAKWTRHFLMPPPGGATAYLDYRNQEFHIAGVLSGDAELLAVLAAPDPYMAFAITAGLAPEGATKQTHPEIRRGLQGVAAGHQLRDGRGVVRVQGEHLPRTRRTHSRPAQAHILAVSRVVLRGRAGGAGGTLVALGVRVAAVHVSVRLPHHQELEDAGQRC